MRLGVAVTTACTGLYPPCVTELPDGVQLPIDLAWKDGGWDWRIRGLVITTDELEAYVRDEVAALGAPQGVRCAPRIQVIVPGDRIRCGLARGGMAFVTVRADGTTAVEIALDPAAANARSELVTPARAEELERTSRALSHGADDEEEEVVAPSTDASVPADPG